MFRDAGAVPLKGILECDVCIVGAGFAGIALASELSQSSMRVVVLESGGLKTDSVTEDLNKGSVVSEHHGPLHLYRQRRFGGTSAVWGGRCAPFDKIDFEQRDWVPGTGWPLSRDDLDPFYERAYAYCDLGRYGVYIDELLAKDHGEFVSEVLPGNVRTDALWLFSPPTNFARKYRDSLEKSKNVQVVLHATCVNITTDYSLEKVECLDVMSSSMNHFSVRAGQYVLASGGLEATRLLLQSDLATSLPALGRFYLSHISGTVGPLQFTPGRKIQWDYERTMDKVYCRRTFRIDETHQRARRLLNFRASLDSPPPNDPRHGIAVLSALYLAKRYLVRRIPPEYSVGLSSLSRYQELSLHVKNLLLGLPSLSAYALKFLFARVVAKRKLPSVILPSRTNSYYLHFDAEQSPNWESRVYLGRDEDRFGNKRLVADWRSDERDIQSVLNSVKAIGDELHSAGAGTLQADDETLLRSIQQSGVGSHHMGLTRMASHPSQGVVDPDCRVFGVKNLYVASSSTFPTGSFANPTLTIVALAIRLSDHLKAVQENLVIGGNVHGGS